MNSKKRIIIIATAILILMPCFSFKNKNEDSDITKNEKQVNYDMKDEAHGEPVEQPSSNKNNENEDISTFSSSTCYKKTYYINADRVNAYEDNSGKDIVKFTLHRNDPIVSYKEQNGYVFCEEGSAGKTGWIRKNKDNLKGDVELKSTYVIDVNLKTQMIRVLEQGKNIKEFQCATGTLGDQDTETPLGKFTVQGKGQYFYSKKYEQGGRYFIKFFGDYLIHSIPVDEKGNIIEEEKNKLGVPVSHGCIRLSMEDAKWVYDKIPKGSCVNIHY